MKMKTKHKIPKLKSNNAEKTRTEQRTLQQPTLFTKEYFIWLHNSELIIE